MEISTAQFKNGLTIELDGKAYQIVAYQHVKPGKGGAFVRTRLKNVETGGVFEKTFRAGAKMPAAHVERRKVQFLYSTGDAFYFMDVDNFDQIELSEEQVGDSKEYLKESDEVGIVRYKGDVIGLELPAAVNLAVSQTDPGIRGDTAQGGTKPAVLETGAVVQVPLFIEIGDVVKVDTRSGEYLERVSQ
ncbi:MAG: elongation factor P [Armatimonadota bacterium]